MLELSLNLLDLTQNSLTAGATLVEITLSEDDRFFTIAIRDNGCGMSEDFVRRVTDPFTTTRKTRKVGFGLPFISQLCDMTDGSMLIESVVGQGTLMRASMGIDHIDRPPLGDIGGTMLSLFISSVGVDYVFAYRTPLGEYTLDTRELREALGDVPFGDPDVIAWLRQNLREGLEEIAPRA